MQTYSLLLGVGALSGLLLACWRAPQKELSCYVNAGIWALFGTLIGSRAATVMVNFPYYQNNPWEIIQVWMGGLSGIGALAGGALSVLIVSKWKNIDTGALADVLFPLAGSVMVTAWLGCWIDNCAYGYPSEAWWALPAQDEWGVTTTRMPVQFLGALSTLAVVWLLERNARRFPICGTSALLGLFLLSTEMLLLSFLRADPTPIVNGLRLEAWGAIGLMILSGLGAGIILVFSRARSNVHS
jgi:prolipoprotein diacylglyceryltransferase